MTACGRLQPSLSLLIEPTNRRVCRASAMTRPLAHKLDNRYVDKLKSDTSAEVFKVLKVQQCSLSDVKYVFGFSDTNLFFFIIRKSNIQCSFYDDHDRYKCNLATNRYINVIWRLIDINVIWPLFQRIRASPIYYNDYMRPQLVW